MSKVSEITKVGNYPVGASPYGVLDMASNAWEWVSSLYQAYPYVAYDGREDMSSVDVRVIRGYGEETRVRRQKPSWWIGEYNLVEYYDVTIYASSTNRVKENPSRYSDQLGFRCALNATP
jgi:formylglycine-generating enzyme required for sulfatase activity